MLKAGQLNNKLSSQSDSRTAECLHYIRSVVNF